MYFKENDIINISGIEKGFESWANRQSDDDEPIDEVGIDPDEHIEFNIIPILDDPNQGDSDHEDFNDDWIAPEDYLPLAKRSFLAISERTAMTANSDTKAVKSESCSLRDDSIRQTEVRAKLRKVVPGLDHDLAFVQPCNTDLELRVVQVTTSTSNPPPTSTSSSSATPSTPVVSAASAGSTPGAAVVATLTLPNAVSSTSLSNLSKASPAVSVAQATASGSTVLAAASTPTIQVN